jgi:hypothetical protein
MSKTLRVGRNSLDVVPQPKSSKVTMGTIRLVPPDLATLLKGLYGKVAQVLDVDPLYVSRVARGQCQSQMIEDALRRELEWIADAINEKPDSLARGEQRKGDGQETEHGGKSEIKVRRFSSR